MRPDPYAAVGFAPMNNSEQSDAGKPSRRDPNRRVIDIYCATHGGARNFTPLVCTKVDGDIQLDPHALGCVLVFDEKAASELFDILGEWLG